MSKKIRITLVCVVCAAVLLAAGVFFWVERKSAEDTVYILATGEVYHTSKECFHIRDKEDVIAIPLSETDRRKCVDCPVGTE